MQLLSFLFKYIISLSFEVQNFSLVFG